MVTGRQVEIDWYDGDRAAIRHLFKLAEDSDVQLDAYIDTGRVLLARCDDEPARRRPAIPSRSWSTASSCGIACGWTARCPVSA